MKLLLHICCAPCATASVAAWRDEGNEVIGTFFNPNIHPFSEHERRRETLLCYAREIGLPLLGEPRYDIKEWLTMVREKEKKGERCRLCIGKRLAHTARLAAENGFTAFSTTLLVSPYQDLEIIRDAGELAAAATGMTFIYRDLTPLYGGSVTMAREAGLYRQNYCGCIFSEEEAARERAARRSGEK